MTGAVDPDRYVVPAQTGVFQLNEKRSRFLAHADRATNEHAAQAVLDAQSRLHHDAAHHCFAWVTPEGERSADAGEPAGTAGRPILDAIRSVSLEQVVVVVTRYFGGVKLGPGGLKRAYGAAAHGALVAAGVRECFHTATVEVRFDHGDTSQVHHWAQHFDARQTGADYAQGAALTFELRRSRVTPFCTALIEATSGRVRIADN